MNIQTSNMDDSTYVFGDLEVKLTGREATKTLEAKGRRTENKTFTLYEITPSDAEEGSWKKWVKITDLYEIGGE